MLSWWGSGCSKYQLSFNLSGFQSLLLISNPAQFFLPIKLPDDRDALKSCLARAGQSNVANIIEKDSLTLIEKSGFAEYYDPITGAPSGGGQFT